MELVREIIYPTENNYTLRLPDEMIGQEVEIIAFRVEEKPKKTVSDKMERLSKSLESLKIDLSNFKFNRDEANDYE
ncbi:MAG: hypothetical protein U5N85_06435 [Arcicella sp.]|nr:hypothetical protein [Arcicella sp.]